MIVTNPLAMSSDERWYEAVKHLKKAAELLDGKLTESTIVDPKGECRKFTIVFDEKKLDTPQEEK